MLSKYPTDYLSWNNCHIGPCYSTASMSWNHAQSLISVSDIRQFIWARSIISLVSVNDTRQSNRVRNMLKMFCLLLCWQSELESMFRVLYRYLLHGYSSNDSCCICARYSILNLSRNHDQCFIFVLNSAAYLCWKNKIGIVLERNTWQQIWIGNRIGVIFASNIQLYI